MHEINEKIEGKIKTTSNKYNKYCKTHLAMEFMTSMDEMPVWIISSGYVLDQGLMGWPGEVVTSIRHHYKYATIKHHYNKHKKVANLQLKESRCLQ